MRLTISKRIAAQAALLTVLAAVVAASEIPAAKSGVTAWYNQNIKPYKERKGTLDPELYAAEETVRIVKVRKDGSGEFATIAAALKTVPVGNTKRVIIDIGPGEYHEKVNIEASQNFVSLVGSSPSNRPVISYGGTAKQYGTVDSATIIILAKYFVGVNLIIKNSAPRPDPYTKDGQALALRINGDKAAFFNCKFVGFQDTLCDDRGYHFFKDCYIEGTVDFIFGRGTSLYVNAELFVIGDKGLTVITAHGNTESTATGFSFVHSTIHGTGKGTTFLGRPWNGMPRVIYAYCEMSAVVTPGGWTDEFSAQRTDKVYFGEYKNTGEGSGAGKRVTYSRELSPAEVKPFISLSYIKGESWLLPPPRV